MIEFDNGVKTYRKLADKKLEENDLEGALGFLLSARDKAKTHLAQIYMDIADVYYEMGLYEIATNYWFKVLDRAHKSDVAEIYNALGLCYFNLDNPTVAAYYFNEQFLNTNGEVFFDEDMSECFEQLLDAKNVYKVVYPPEKVDYSGELKKGKSAMTSYDIESAVEHFSNIPEGSPDYERAQVDLSVAKFLTGDVDGAIELNKKVLESNSKNVLALCNLATMYRFKERPNLAEKYFSLIDESYATEDDELYKVATTCCENGKHERAAENFEKLLKTRPYNTSIMFFYAVSLYNSGKFNESRDNFKRLLMLTEDNPVALYYYRLADNLVENGAKTTEPISYYFRLPEDVEKANLKALASLLKMRSQGAIRKKFREKSTQELLSWCFTSTDKEVQRGACYFLSAVDNKQSEKMLLDKLIDPSITDSIKGCIVNLLVMGDYEKTVGLVTSNVYRKLDFYPLYLQSEFGEKFTDAYALAYSRAAIVGEYEMRMLYDSANAIYYENEYSEALQKAEVNVIAGLIWAKSGIEEISSVEKIAKSFNCSKEELVSLMESIKNHE